MSTDSSDSESLEINKPEAVSKSLKKFIIVIGGLVWVVAFFTVSYHCFEIPVWESEPGENFLATTVNVVAAESNDNHELKSSIRLSTSTEHVAQFQQLSPNTDSMTGNVNSKVHHKFKDKLSKTVDRVPLKSRISSDESSKDFVNDQSRLEPLSIEIVDKSMAEFDAVAVVDITEQPQSVLLSQSDKKEISQLENLTQILAISESTSDISDDQQIQIFTTPTISTQTGTEGQAIPEPQTYNLGEIRSISSETLCLDASSVDGSTVTLYECHGQDGNQHWEMNEHDELKRGVLCVDYFGGPLFLFGCHASKGNQQWIYQSTKQVLHHPISNTCLTITDGSKISMKPCNDALQQKWWWTRKDSPSIKHLLSNNEL